VVVRSAGGRHPGGVLAYRVEHGGKSIVYATDTEHPESGVDESLLTLARGADVLIYDAMYTPDEYEGRADGISRRGWGHSTYVAGAELAKAAGVGRYVLFHHDPDQDDAAVREKENAAKALFENSLCAYEGLVLELA
jgi:ribonuclease BN (tRNA processing enzyme)